MKSILRMSHIIKKILCFALFGLGGVLLTLIVFPLVLVLVRNKNKQDRLLRYIIQLSFSIFTKVMIYSRVIELDFSEYTQLKSAKQKVICANHPTLLDVVIIMGFVRNADCIVKASLWKNPFIRMVINKLYIPNSLNSDETLERCIESLERGNNIVLFPETTRTVHGKKVKFHRSAAHIALHSGYEILPVHIDVVLPSGLGKNDKFLSAPPRGIIEYIFSVRDCLDVSKYSELHRPIAARQLTDELFLSIFA